MQNQRIEFCKKYKDLSVEDWSRFIYSDESYVQINFDQIMNRIRRTSLENPLLPKFTAKSVKHPLKVMIWGCFNQRGPGRIHICEGSMNSKYYLEILNRKLLPSVQDFDIDGEVFHLDDSARPHRTKEIINWHETNNIKKIQWPGNSPDLNPIENLWAILKAKLKKKRNLNQRELISNIVKVWFHEIPKDIFKNLSDSMPNRIKKVLKNKGNTTKY